jgi:hypothetical protein
MRFVLTVLSICVVSLLLVADRPERYAAVRDEVAGLLQSVLYEREVQISGLKRLSESEIREILPRDHSTPWWLINGAIIETSLLGNSLIQKADIKPCGLFELSCFKLAIEERQAGLFAIVDDRGWLIGRDGGQIMPVTLEEIQRYQEGKEQQQVSKQTSGRRLPVVSGLRFKEESPDVIRARFERLRKAIDLIEESAGYTVRSIELTSNQELDVRFYGLSLKAVFDLSQDQLENADNSRLSDRAIRLKLLLKQFGDRRSAIESVDLAPEKMAVVKLRGG